MRFCKLFRCLISLTVFVSLLIQGTGGFTVKAQEQRFANRFQYHKFHWRAYHGKTFHIYFPADASDSLYRYLVKELPAASTKIKKATILQFPKDVSIIIYPSVDQVYESNIGLHEPKEFTFPSFLYKGTRVVVEYNGSYDDLKKQLYESLTRVIVESALRKETKVKGTDVGDVKDSKKDAPFWFREGMTRYFAHGWRVGDEDLLRRSFQDVQFSSWQQVLNYQPRLAGQAFCYFISQRYYPTAVAQILNLLQKKKPFPTAIKLITNDPLDTLYSECFKYYSERFEKKDFMLEYSDGAINLKRKKGIISSVLVSPDKKKVAYLALYNGKRTLYIHNVQSKLTRKIGGYKLPPWIDNHSADPYPLLHWYPDSKRIYVVQPHKGKIRVKSYALDGRLEDKFVLPGVDGLCSFQPLSNNEFLLTAHRKAQSDVVSYSSRKLKYQTFTDDEYDDTRATFVSKKDELLFVSSRPREYQEQKTYLIGVGYKPDTLWQGIYRKSNGELSPVVVDSVDYVKWDKPVFTNDGSILVTTTKYGKEQNVRLDGASVSLLGAYRPFQFLETTNEIFVAKTENESIQIRTYSFDKWLKLVDNIADSSSPWLTDHKILLAKQAKEDSILRKAKDTTHYVMDDMFSSPEDKKDSKNRKRKSNGPYPYMLQLHSAYFSAGLNNDYFINRYQPFRAYQGEFKFPEITGLTKASFTDLFENHHFTLAFSLPLTNEGSNFFAKYENTSRKFDWGVSYFRKVEMLKPDPKRNWVDENGNKYPDNAKAKTHYYEFLLRRPLSYYSSISFQTAVRYDKTIFLATDKYTLDFAPVKSTWSINTFSFNLNKLKPTIPLLYKGFTCNANIDLLKSISKEEDFVFGASLHFKEHIPIYKFITAVPQLHIGYSAGDNYLLYNLAGTDNNLIPEADTNKHFPQSAPYAFQTLITPFRGYLQNTVYGNAYAVINLDVYAPIFKTIVPIETPLPFVNNFQVGLLSDWGTVKETWSGSNGKLYWSYGISARSVLAGYPLRLDVAWPGTFSKRPLVCFSLGL